MAILAAIAIGVIYYRLFVLPSKMEQERGGRIVVEEQADAAAATTQETIDTVRMADEHREYVHEQVSKGQARVNRVDKGGTIDPEVDAAGAAALCGLHDSLCRD